jgi:hypothetical protein
MAHLVAVEALDLPLVFVLALATLLAGVGAQGFVLGVLPLLLDLVTLVLVDDELFEDLGGQSRRAKSCAGTDRRGGGVISGGERGEKRIGIIIISDGLPHGSKLLSEVSKILEMRAYAPPPRSVCFRISA